MDEAYAEDNSIDGKLVVRYDALTGEALYIAEEGTFVTRFPQERPMKDGASKQRSPWEAMALRKVGRLADIVAVGGGKVSVVVGDPGEPKKVPSLEK